MTVAQCIRDTYSTLGVRGFYKGITASYYGISETVIHFVIYEAIKAKLAEIKQSRHPSEDSLQRNPIDFLEFMGAGATSKTIATCVAYPHGRLESVMHKATHFGFRQNQHDHLMWF